MRTLILALALTVGLGVSAQAAEKYAFDSSHSQAIFSYNHLGYSTTFGMFSGFTGQAMLDAENPENSSVTASIKVADLITGWGGRTKHFLSADFFNAEMNDTITFTSTKVETTGEKTAKVTGNLELNGVELPITLDVVLNKMGDHPRAKKPWAGFDASVSLTRSDFKLGLYAPYVGDAVDIKISVEMAKAD